MMMMMMMNNDEMKNNQTNLEEDDDESDKIDETNTSDDVNWNNPDVGQNKTTPDHHNLDDQDVCQENSISDFHNFDDRGICQEDGNNFKACNLFHSNGEGNDTREMLKTDTMQGAYSLVKENIKEIVFSHDAEHAGIPCMKENDTAELLNIATGQKDIHFRIVSVSNCTFYPRCSLQIVHLKMIFLSNCTPYPGNR